MKYREAIISSYLKTTNTALDKLASGNDEINFMRTQVKISKVFKRYLDNQAAAEEYAAKLGEYSIKQVDDYLKSLKEAK